MSRVPLRSPKLTKDEAEVGFTMVWLLVEPAGLEEYDHWYEAPVSALALAMVTEAGAQIAESVRVKLANGRGNIQMVLKAVSAQLLVVVTI